MTPLSHHHLSRTTAVLFATLILTSPACHGPVADPAAPASASASAPSPENTDRGAESDGLLFEAAFPSPEEVAAAPISEFVRRIHQDRRGHLWFGTNGDGVLRYDGETLEQFEGPSGLGGPAIRAFVEDADGTLWVGTNGGVSRYADGRFITSREAEGLPSRDIWSLFVDADGDLWAGTLEGAARRDPETGRFIPFALPAAPAVDELRGVSSRHMVNAITQDADGALWFAVGSGGLHRFDGRTITSLTSADGLIGDSVNDVLVDRRGDLWVATHWNGVGRRDGTSFVDVLAAEGLEHKEAWSLFEDRQGGIWFPVEGAGLYRHDGTTLTRFTEEDGLPSAAIQCVFQDRAGHIWVGGYGGLARLDGDRFTSVRRNGPWTGP